MPRLFYIQNASKSSHCQSIIQELIFILILHDRIFRCQSEPGERQGINTAKHATDLQFFFVRKENVIFSFLTKKNIFNFVKFKMIWNESMKYPHV